MHKCAVCDQTTTRKDDLVRHIHSCHLKDRLKCSLCEKDFSRKDSLKRHIKNIHVEETSSPSEGTPSTSDNKGRCTNATTSTTDLRSHVDTSTSTTDLSTAHAPQEEVADETWQEILDFLNEETPATEATVSSLDELTNSLVTSEEAHLTDWSSTL